MNCVMLLFILRDSKEDMFSCIFIYTVYVYNYSLLIFKWSKKLATPPHSPLFPRDAFPFIYFAYSVPTVQSTCIPQCTVQTSTVA